MKSDMEKPLETLYRSLLENNYDVPDSYESFERTLTAPGKEGVRNRQQLHRSLVDNGYDVPEDYSRFSRTLFAPVKPKAAAPKPQQTPAGGAAFGLPEGMAYSDEVESRHNSPSNAAGSYKDRAQIASEVQSEGLPAYRQGSKKPVQRDASSYGIPYRPDTELTAAQRDEIAQQNGYAVRQVKQMRQQREKERRRRNQPVVDTGNENVNRHVIKTQGQWEDEVTQGASRISSSVVSPAVKSAIAEFDKRADEIWGKYHDQSKYVDAASPWSVVTARQANEARDPEKILNYLNEQMKGLYDDESFAAKVGREADKMGVSRDEYMEKIMMPQIEADIRREFDDTMLKREMPKGSFDYIMKGLGNSIAGMLASRLMETEGQRRYKNEAAAMTEEGLNPHYTPGTGAKLAQMGVSFAADAPFFGFYGKVGGNVAKGLAERQIRKLTAKGLSEGAARSIVGTALENSVGQRMKNYIMQHVVSSSITMGGYNATSETARQVRDREFKPGQIIGSTAEGLATGAAFGLTGGAVQALSQPLSGIAKIGSKVGGYLTEGETMYATEELAKMVHGEEGFTNPFEGSAEAMMKLGVMKVSSPGGLSKAAGELFHPVKSNRRQQTGVRFTPEEEAYVRDSADGKSLLDALSQMHPEVATTEVKGKRRLTAEGEQMRQELAERYDAFMGNTEIPYAVKAKVAGALGGLMPDAAHTPLETGVDIIHNADGSVILKTRDKDGNCMQELKFDSFSEADNWREEHEGDFRLNDAVNMWNGASPEARANTIRQLMEEYGIGEEEAATMVKSALGGSMGKDFSNDQLLYVYNTVRDNAYPADEPNTRRNYWEGQKLTPQERHQAMVEAQQAEDRLTYMDQEFADEVIGAADYPDEKIAELAGRDEITGEQLEAAIDYYNKMSKYSGMMEGALQGIDDQVEAANAFVRRNTHTDSGNVVEVESGGRGYYLTAGKLELNPDGTVNLTGSGDVMILRDKDTGEIQVVTPSKLHITALSDPQLMIVDNESMEGLRGRLMQEANNSITLAEGTPEAPQNGDYFTGADGIRYMAIGVPDEQGNVVWSKIALDEKGEPVGEPKDLDIDEYRKAKSDEIDIERISGGIKEKEDEIKGQENGQNMSENAVDTTSEITEHPDNEEDSKGQINGQKRGQNEKEIEKEKESAINRIPVDEKGRQQFELARPEDTVAELTERYGEEKTRKMIATMAENTARAYEELSQKNTSKMTDMAELAAHEDALAEAARKRDYWAQFAKAEEPSEKVVSEEKPAEELPTVEKQEAELDNAGGEAGAESSTGANDPSATASITAADSAGKTADKVQPQQPTAEQKIAEGSVKANLGKTFEYRHSDGRRIEMRLESISPGGRAVVTQTDYDAQGNRIGEPQRKVYNATDIGGSIIKGAMKPVLSTEEKLRAAYKGRVGIQNVIDVLTDAEQEQMLRVHERGDNEALKALMHEFTETHREDIILNERDKRNANVSQIMEGSGSREDKLRRVRKQYQGYDDAVLALSDEAMQPTTLEEYVADLHSRVPKSGEGPIAYFSYDRDGTKVVGIQDETGHGSKTGGDTKGYAPWLAPKGKGVSLAKYAEQIHEQLPEGIKAQYSDQDVRNAILEVFGGAERPSDITTMVIKRGIIQAEQAARHMEEMWIEGGPSFHRVSIDDNTFAGRLARGKQQTNTEPTEKQKEAGNYKKGHVSFGGYDFVIENPEGSMRRGKDADGNTWEQQMHNTYGYILGKKGKDGDHLDMFINDAADLDNWNEKVYVVDQVNADGSFDESKIMYGFDSEAEAREAYLSNYKEGWQGLGRITGVDKDTFDKWLDSSTRQMKPFAEHSIIRDAVKPVEAEPQAAVTTPAEREKVLMDAVVEKMKEAGIDVSTDLEEGQKVLDDYNGSHELKPMGSRVDSKKSQLASEFEGRELTPEQQAVVDVYTGKRDNVGITFTRDGQEHTVTMRQGNENKAGTKHSLYRHYGTGVGVITADDVMRIPDVLSNGEREEKKRGNVRLAQYRLTDENGKRYTVVTEIKKAGEVFNDFYTNKKASSQTPQMPNGDTPESARTKDLNASSGAKVQQNPETTKESVEKLKQFKTSDGHAYGFTYKGKIYIDPRIATSETPIHEYGHLWAEMKRQTAPEEWDAIKDVLLNDKLVKPIIDRVKKDYPELAKEGREDDFIEEILTQFSGKRGAERLREIAEEIAAEKGGVFGKAEAVTAMQRLKSVLAKFWAGVAKMMGWKYRNANEIADKMMSDLLEGVNPREKVKETSHKQRQLEIVTRENPMHDDYHTGIRKLEDIKTFEEAYDEGKKASEEGGWDEYASYPDITNELIEDARKSGKITVYSSYPIKDGVFVTPSMMQAKDYAGEGRVYSKRVPLEDVAWINLDEGQYAKVSEAPRKQLVGKKGAAEADNSEGSSDRMDSNRIAEEMEKSGKDAKAIKLATGWERAADGKWRYEIPDADVDILSKFDDKMAEMKANGVESPEPILKLGELLGEDNDLFKYYPKMKDMQVLFSKRLPDGTAGAYGSGTIELNIKEASRFLVEDLNNENVYGTLLHEVQHAIQDIEGFAKGGSLYTSTTDEGLNAIIERKQRQADMTRQKLKANNRILYDPEELKMAAELEEKSEKEVRDRLQETTDQQAAELDAINLQIERIKKTKTVSMTDAKDLYRRLAGEVESRNVTKRMDMSEEQRRQSLASDTEDLYRDDQVIIMGDGTAMSIDGIKPVGTGDFGDIYDQFKGKPKEAVEFLLKKKGGEAVGALSHKDVGDIDLVWGEEGTGKSDGFGLAKLAKYHPEVLDNLQEILDDMHVVQRTENRVNLESDTHKAAVRLTWNKEKKNWLLTAFEKKNSALDNTTDTGKTSDRGKRNDTATPQSTVSEGKVTKKSDTLQGNEEKSSDEAPKFQRVGNPEPELTPEEKQYWKQWDAAMKKWKERNALPADADGPGEQPAFSQGESMLDYAKRVVAHNRAKALWQTAPKLEDYRQVRDDKAAQDEAHANEKAYPGSELAKRMRVATDLARLRHAMSRQKAYDKVTVKAVTDFAQDFMRMGFGDNLGRGEMERLLSSVKNATGAKDIRNQVDNIMNILIDNQLRNLDQQVVKLSSVKELSKTAQGVEKQGRLELKGQRMIQAFRQAREGRMDAEKIRERLGEVAEKMSRNDEEAPMWEQEYEGLSIALQYQENIEGSRDEWADLDREYKDAMKGYKQSGRSYKAQQELLESLEQAMMENKIERIGMFGDIIGRLQGNISESMQGAKEFVEREKERVKKIQQMANFDLAGKPADAFREKVKGKPANFFLQPLGTFEQMLKQFGSRNANGEGYLYDYFMRSWMDSTDKAFLGEEKAKEDLDAKAREVFGDKVKRWSDLYDITRKLPTLEVEVLDGEDPKTFTLNQGNLLYIYMADKMTDGRMKLRKMGIDEETVEKVKDFLDPRLVQLGDWLQDEYLVQKRTEYNKVHERMFGAPMAAIDHYFPLKILGDARYQEQDVSNMADQDAVLPSTITGNIIKRRKNALPLDILHTDALSLAIEHVEDMERWAATAEWNKDINTLLSYTTFRNKVKNMKTIYGSGDALWNTFVDAARMAAGTYRPKAKPGSVDSAISNIAKGVTAAKINFRVYTAFKQILSAPAFLHDVNIGDFVKNSVNPYGSWKWAMENMPVFEKRWKSRQVGDTRLMDDPTDWKMWKTNLVQLATRMGMSPNALVDGVTCAVGARSIYESRYRKYKKIGASDEVAQKRALQDAEIGYNLTQQSSEGAFVSAIQKDRTVAANMLSVFRNSSMAYTRQWVDAARNLKHRTQKGYKEDAIGFMTRQLQEQFGLDEAQAKKAAEAEYARAGRHDVARLLNMMFGVTVAWNLGASLPYLLIGDDDETKKEMMTDALLRGLAAGPTEGLAAGNLFSEFVSRSFASEQTRKAFWNEGWGSAIDSALKQGGDYEVNPLPLMADIQGMIKKMGYDKFAAAQDVFNICAQSAVGVNPQTFTDMWNACMDYGAPGWDGTKYSADADNLARPKEIALFIMRLMNAPTSSWRNKYIDELGMNAEDAQKLSYEEMASRYAHYKHWKDAPIMGWLRGEEGREEKIGKIRKQFDKSVQERIDRLDEEELRDNLLRSKSLEERRLLAKAVASRFGLAAGEDAKNAKEQWQQNYQQLMEYEDIREDALLSAKKKEANARGDKETVKAINALQGRIREKGKKKLGGEDDDELMRKIRQWRREALEKALQAESR